MSNLLDIITCVIGTFGFSVLLKVSKQKIILTVTGGIISAVISVAMLNNGFSTFKSTFFAMTAICIYSEILARITKTPVNVILMPSTVPLLPGGSLYYTMSCLVHSEIEMFFHYAKETVLTGLGIALGAIFVSIIITFVTATKKDRIKRY